MTQSQQFQRSTPEAQGISSAAVLAFLDAVQAQGVELHSLMLVRHGQVVAEGWWAPYGPESVHLLYSLSKSFTSTAVGLAVAEGRLSVDDTVLSFFPDDAPAEVSPNLAAMRVRHLLSMSTGNDKDTTDGMRQDQEGNWAKAFLAAPVEHEPGTHFVYNSGTTYMLSAIVHKLTGMPLLDYLRPRLLDPLGIEQATWETDPRGVNVGGWGMSVTTESIARFGQLYLQRGNWHGTQLIPASWVDEATKAHVSNGSDPESDWAQGYGYQFWRCRHNAYRGDGAFGQYCVVMPDQDAVLAITSGVSDMQNVLNLVWEHVLPAMGPAALPEDQAAHGQLRERLSSLALALPEGARSSSVAERVSGRTYTFEPNELQIEAITLDFRGDTAGLTVQDDRGAHTVKAGYGTWQRGTSSLEPGKTRAVVGAGAWVSDDTYVATHCFYETPHSMTMTFKFDGDRLLFDFGMNVSFGPTQFPQLVGQATDVHEPVSG